MVDLISRLFIASLIRFRASGAICFSHIGRGITPKHRPAIQQDMSGGNNMKFQFSEFQSLLPSNMALSIQAAIAQ